MISLALTWLFLWVSCGEPLETSTEAPVATATARVRQDRTGDQLLLTAEDGLFNRLNVERGEVLHLEVSLSGYAPDLEIRVEAGNGGSINHRLGPLVVSPSQLEREGGTLSFDFTVGKHKGLYTLEVSQGRRQELLELWVGDEPPTGRPGPARVFVGR